MALMSTTTHTTKPRAATVTASAAPLQRSFTLPTKLANAPVPRTSPAVEIGASEAIETLYVHPGAKIVSFSTSGTTTTTQARPSSSSSRASVYDGIGGESGTLPWSNATERTLAAGPLEIYRVPGSVSFLHSGNLLHAILPRSQCWCVDGVSKFAFRVRPDTYYRIELPGEGEDNLEMVEQLKITLAKVLYYERTSCPFRRGFGTDLPEMPDLPRRTMSRGGSVDPAKRWRFDRKWRPEGVGGNAEEGESSQESTPNSGHGTPSPANEDTATASENQAESGAVRVTRKPSLSHLSAPTPFAARNMRSVTAPPQLDTRSGATSGPKALQIASRIQRINEAVRSQTEASQSTPMRRKHTGSSQTTPVRQAPVDAPTPKLPPTPESIHDDFIRGGLDEEHDDDDDDNESSGESTNWTVHERRLEERISQESIKEESEDDSEEDAEAESEEGSEDEVVPEGKVPSAPSSSTQPDPTPVSDDPRLQQRLEQPNRTPEIPIPGAQDVLLPTSRSQAVLPQFDDVRETTTTPSPDPSLSSVESWRSLPAEPEQETQTLRPRLARSAASSSSHRSRPSQDALTFRVPPAPPLSLTQHYAQRSTAVAIAGTGALLVKRTAQIFLGPPAHLVVLMLKIAAKIIAGGGDDGVSLTVPVIPPGEAHAMIRDRERAASSGVEGLGMTGLKEMREREATRGRSLGHRRLPGSFEFSDDEEEWGDM